MKRKYARKLNSYVNPRTIRPLPHRVGYGAANHAALTLNVYLAYPEAVKCRSRCYRGGVLGKVLTLPSESQKDDQRSYKEIFESSQVLLPSAELI